MFSNCRKIAFSLCFLSQLPSLGQNIDSVATLIADKSVASQSRYYDDLAWDNMYINFEYAYNYAIKANEIAVVNDLKKAQGSTFNTLGVICRRQGLFEDSKKYYRQAKAIWDELDITKQKVTFHMNMANVVRAQGINDSAIYHGNLGLKLATQLSDSIRMSSMIVGLGTTYKNMGWYETAIDYYSQGAQIDQSLYDTIGLGVYWSNIGDVMVEQGDFEEALKYYEITREVDQYANNKLNESITLQSMGRAYHALEKYDTALQYFNDALTLSKEIGDELLHADVLRDQANLLVTMSDTEEALALFDKVLAINRSYNDPLLKAATYLGKGNALLSIEEYQSSISILETANRLASEINYDDVLVESHRSLANAYRETGQNDEAFSNLNHYVTLNDSLHNLAIASRVAELENKYELSNKEQQIALLNANNEVQKAQLTQRELELQRNQALIILLILAIMIGVFWYRRQLLKQKLKSEQERAQLKSAQIKAVIQSQEDERKRFAMDLHDDFGQLISAVRIQANVVGLATTVKDKINGQLDQMYGSLKSIAFNLMPQTLIDKGLGAAVEELCIQLNQLGGLEFRLHAFDITDRLGNQEKVAAYRIIQEVVNNIIKYANASKVTINMTGLGDKLSIMIEDDGDGFDVNNLKKGLGNGWRNIQSRLDLLTGQIEFDSYVGRKNTTVTIEIPYYKPSQQAA